MKIQQQFTCDNLSVSDTSYPKMLIRLLWSGISFALLAIIACSVVSFLPIGPFYYVSIILLFVMNLHLFRFVVVNRVLAIYLLSCAISICINDIPSVFVPIPRFLVYLIEFIVFSPFLFNHSLYEWRKSILLHLLFLCLIIVLFSLFAFLLFGIGIDEKDLGFKGITASSMTLAPIAVFSLFYVCYAIPDKWFFRIIFVLLSLFVVVLAGSRSALFAMLVAYFASLYIESKSKFMKHLVVCFLFGLISFPLWKTQLEVFEKKMEIQERMDGDNSRTSKWNNRLNEFYSHPLFGIGFSSVDLDKSSADYVKDTGTIEPGSSWLAILSMIGLFGFFPFTLLFFLSFLPYLRNQFLSSFDILCFQLLVFFAIHFVFEGYLFGIGNLLLIIFLLSLSGSFHQNPIYHGYLCH